MGVPVDVDDIGMKLRIEFEKPLARGIDIRPAVRLPFERKTLLRKPHTRHAQQFLPLFVGWRRAKNGNQHFGSIGRQTVDEVHGILPNATYGVGSHQDS